MSKLGKILGPVLVVLTIAAAVFSVLIANKRQMFRDRAAILSKGLSEVASKLDAEGNEGVQGKVTFQSGEEKESGSLGWEEFQKGVKAGSSDYQSNISATIKLAEDVIAQRECLIDALIAVTNNAVGPVDSNAKENLTKLSSYADVTTKFNVNSSKIRARDKEVVNQFNRLGSLVGAPRINDNNIYGKADCNYNIAGAVTPIYNAMNDQQAALLELCRTMAELQKRTTEFKWSNLGIKPGAKISASDAKRASSAILADATKLNNELAKVNQLKRDLASNQEKSNRQATMINEMEDQIHKLTETKAELERRILKLTGGIDLEPGVILASPEQVNPETQGLVMKVDKSNGFIIINLSQSEIAVDSVLAVSNMNTYLGTFKVTSTGKYMSIAYANSPSDLEHVQPGNVVVIADVKMHELLNKKD